MGLLLEIAHRRWKDEGQVVVLSRGDSSPAFDRLLHGVRLGIKSLPDGTDFCEADLLRWDRDAAWGSVSMTTENELGSVVGAEIYPLLVEAGALDLGSRQRVLKDAGNRRNRMCATFPSEDPVTPLVVYVITRVLPIVGSLEVS